MAVGVVLKRGTKRGCVCLGRHSVYCCHWHWGGFAELRFRVNVCTLFACLHAIAATVDQRQGLEHQGKGSSARSIASAGSSTLLAAAPAAASRNLAEERSAALPSTAPSSLPDPSSRRGDNAVAAGLVLPVSPQQQQRWGATPAPAPGATVDGEEEDKDGDDGTADAGASCATSAVTIPRAAWAEDGDFILNDISFDGGSGSANDKSSAAAAASLGAGEGTGPRPGEGIRSPTAAGAEAMSGLWHGEQRCAGGPGCEPKQAAFGKASTKV